MNILAGLLVGLLTLPFVLLAIQKFNQSQLSRKLQQSWCKHLYFSVHFQNNYLFSKCRKCGKEDIIFHEGQL